jgi:DMSO reductase anchor subunit
MAGLFTIAWALTTGLVWFRKASPNPWPMAILGLGLVYSMSQVYLLRAVPGWNTWRTPAAFFLSAIVLGVLGTSLIRPLPGLAFLAAIAMTAEIVMLLASYPVTDLAAARLRLGLLAMAILGALLMAIFPQISGVWLSISVLIIALAAEAIGRWQFYAGRVPFPLRVN